MRDWIWRWEKIRARGKAAYILMVGCAALIWVLLVKAVISLRYHAPFFNLDLIYLAFLWTLVGFLVGIFMWIRLERKYHKLTSS